MNGFDTCSFTKRKIIKLFNNSLEGERNVSLHRRRWLCEVRVKMDDLDYEITPAILPCFFVKKRPAESMIIKKENMDVKCIEPYKLGGR